MLANCSVNNCLPGVLNAEGGDADMGNGIVYLPVPVPESGLILHESAHAVAKLGEEYVNDAPVRCVSPTDPNSWNLYAFPNIATKADVDGVDGRTVLWKDLANRGTDLQETEPGGDFKAFYKCDADRLLSQYCQDNARNGLCKMLGLFWGAMYGTVFGGSICVADCHYRPMHSCRMRDHDGPDGFCRVCDCALRKAIWAAAPDSKTSSDPFSFCEMLPDLPSGYSLDLRAPARGVTINPVVHPKPPAPQGS